METIRKDQARIYKLVDSLPSDVVYIGRTVRPLEIRRRQHVCHSGRGMMAQAPVYAWIRSLLRERREPLIVEIECVPVEQAVAAEDEWIARYRASGAKVLNIRSGASGNARRGIYQQRRSMQVGYGYRGVTRSGKTRWRAYMRHNYTHQNLGTYATAEEAAHAYDKAAIALFGAAALLNFPLEKEPGE